MAAGLQPHPPQSSWILFIVKAQPHLLYPKVQNICLNLSGLAAFEDSLLGFVMSLSLRIERGI